MKLFSSGPVERGVLKMKINQKSLESYWKLLTGCCCCSFLLKKIHFSPKEWTRIDFFADLICWLLISMIIASSPKHWTKKIFQLKFLQKGKENEQKKVSKGENEKYQFIWMFTLSSLLSLASILTKQIQNPTSPPSIRKVPRRHKFHCNAFSSYRPSSSFSSTMLQQTKMDFLLGNQHRERENWTLAA